MDKSEQLVDPYKGEDWTDRVWSDLKLGWYGLQELPNSLYHIKARGRLGEVLQQQYPNLDPGEYDQAKNWVGGYDWGIPTWSSWSRCGFGI